MKKLKDKKYNEYNDSETRKQVKSLCLVILLVLVVLVGSSYAWFTATDDADKNVVVTAGSLNIEFSDAGNDIELSDQVPISTTDALKQEGYTFTITNNGTIESDYTVSLIDVELLTGQAKLDEKYVRYDLEKDGVEVGNDLMSTLVDNKLFTSTLKPGKSTEYKLRLYLDENEFNTDATDKIYKKTIKIDAVQHSGKTDTLVCTLKSGLNMKIGSMYECDPGDGTVRNFYALELRDNEIDLIMDRNISQGTNQTTMSYTDALSYMTNKGYTSSWKNALKIDLPGAQQIANAVENTSWKVNSSSNSFCFGDYGSSCLGGSGTVSNQARKYNWLFNYTSDCTNSGCDNNTNLDSSEAYGYWTKSLQYDNSNNAWEVSRSGILYNREITNTAINGVRPVITVARNRMSL